MIFEWGIKNNTQRGVKKVRVVQIGLAGIESIIGIVVSIDTVVTGLVRLVGHTGLTARGGRRWGERGIIGRVSPPPPSRRRVRHVTRVPHNNYQRDITDGFS